MAFLNQKPVLRRDLESERQTSSEERAYGHGFGRCARCLLPFAAGGSERSPWAAWRKIEYREADAEFLTEVAEQIAIAVDNVSAYEESQALKARFEAEAVYLQEEIKTEHNFEEIIGQSAPVRELLRNVEQVAPTRLDGFDSRRNGHGQGARRPRGA